MDTKYSRFAPIFTWADSSSKLFIKDSKRPLSAYKKYKVSQMYRIKLDSPF